MINNSPDLSVRNLSSGDFVLLVDDVPRTLPVLFVFNDLRKKNSLGDYTLKVVSSLKTSYGKRFYVDVFSAWEVNSKINLGGKLVFSRENFFEPPYRIRTYFANQAFVGKQDILSFLSRGSWGVNSREDLFC
jgi:hypothetical protein